MIHEDFQGRIREVGWGALQDDSNRFANVLRSRGVEPGDRVAMLLPPTPETAAAFFGVWKAGAILLSMSVLYGDEGIRHRSTTRGRRCCVTNAANAGRIERDLVRASAGARRRAPGRTARPRSSRVDTAAEDPAQLYYSSGTTGLAKGILHAHRYILAHEEFIYCHDLREGEVFHGMGEWAWAAGICPLLGPWRMGAVQAVYQREGGFDPHKQLDFLSRHGVTNVFGTPTAIRSMMSISDAGTRYPQKFRIVCSAGEPLNPEAIRWVREQYGVTVLDYYGLTESYPLCANYPFMEVREGSMGKPMPGGRWRSSTRTSGPSPPASAARSACEARSNPHYPLGYWNRPAEDTEEAFGGDWFHTKDAARADEDGYFWYEGRADDVIISAGYRIGPFEVESACLEHPAVAEAAAVASPDERRGYVVKAFVVLAAGHDPSPELADEIKSFVRERYSAYSYPRRDRVRPRPAQDADRQDPADRAAPGRAGARERRAGPNAGPDQK